MKNQLKIAYLAPEIPALSATFVYNEILDLEKSGYQVVPLSVHQPHSPAEEEALEDLGSRTKYLYLMPKSKMLWDNLHLLVRRPVRYLRVLASAVGDVWRVGLFNRVGLGLLYRFLVAAGVARILLDENCTHLHVHFAHIPTDIAMYAAGMSAVPFSFTAHANDLFERGWLLEKKVRRAKFAVTISEYNRQFLIEKGGPGDKIHVVRCGVDHEAFAAGNARPSNSIPKIGTLGRMVEKKGIDDLIRACQMLKDRNIGFNLEIAGDGPMQSELQALVNDGDLAEQVHFTGPLAHEQVPRWLQSLDMFVLACKKDRNGDMDGIPVVLMEAMLAGVPVISCRISGIPELIEDGQSGLLAEPGNPAELARVIDRLLSDDNLHNDFRTNAMAKVQAEFELSKNVAVLDKLFREVIR
ncbi:MAG: glycosyltransferase family 4 protein [Deltaproteobacteria bacterium]|nr:glycosyltransferase family 4 protein [Deltaproteobacteria bacterium]